MSLVRINNIVVKSIPLVGGGDSRPIRGWQLISELYANLFLCARKMTGKTTALNTILKKCTGRDTKILAFCSTLHKDHTWQHMKQWCAKHNIPFESHTSLNEEGEDLLTKFLDAQVMPDECEEDKKTSKKKNLLLLDDEEDEVKPKKTKYRAPDWTT